MILKGTIVGFNFKKYCDENNTTNIKEKISRTDVNDGNGMLNIGITSMRRNKVLYTCNDCIKENYFD